MQFLELEPLLAEAADALAATGARMGIGRTAAQAANLLEQMGPGGVAAGVAASAMAAKRPFGMLTDSAYKAGKKMKQAFDDRFTPKRLFEDIEQSLLPAHKKRRTQAETAGMPRRPAKVVRKASKATKKRGTVKKRTSAKKKAKAKRKKSTVAIRKNVVHKQQPHGKGERDDVMYLGFQHHGGVDEILEAVVDSVLRKHLAKHNITVDNPDTELPVAASTPMISRGQLQYRVTNFDVGQTAAPEVGQIVDFEATIYQVCVQQIALEIRTKVREGKMPVQLIFTNSADQPVYKDRRFADAIVQVATVCDLKLRNITPNDSATGTETIAGDRFALDTNPLKGKMYVFNGDVPIVKNILADPESSSGPGTVPSIRTAFAKFHDRHRSKGVCGTAFVNSDPIFQADQILCTPPVGNKVFQNCKKTINIAMGPGGSYGHRMRFSYRGTLYNFIRDCVGMSVYDNRRFGACTWFGLEQMYASKGAIGDGHDTIRVEYDASYTLRAGTKLAPRERSPTTVDAGLINL